MGASTPDISVIIVNYNVKEYLSNLLKSLEKASHHIQLEVFVVDNASKDGSREMIPNAFPGINYIYNEENVGFGKANNQAIALAKGKYTLIINPDTLVGEDTLQVLYDYMEAHSECAAAGCKILNPDGTFAPESRRSVPTIRSAASKVLGLNSLFPKSKFFAEYYLGWLEEDEECEVPVLSGSFMFFKTKVLKELNGFDERFFMYGEDIDLCYRTAKKGYSIRYIPSTSIIHYKGESTKKGDLKYVRLFNKANYQFFQKHYTSRYSLLFKSLIYLAIAFKGFTSFLSTQVGKIKLVSVDLISLNLSLFIAFVVRFAVTDVLDEKLNSFQSLEFLWVNTLLTILYVIFSFGFSAPEKQTGIPESLKANFLSYSGVTIITFFARELAFSRIVLGLSFILTSIFLIATRLIRINYSRDLHAPGRIKNIRLLIVGSGASARDLVRKIGIRPDWDYHVAGYVSVNDTTEQTDEVLGNVTQLRELIKNHKIDHVYFMLSEISYKQMLVYTSRLRKEDVVFKIVPENMEFILGKSNVDYIDSIPVVEVDLLYNQSLNKFLKRSLDITIALPLCIICFVASFIGLIRNRVSVNFGKGLSFFTPLSKHNLKNRTLLFWYVLIGRLSIVGAPLNSTYPTAFKYKKGVTGIVQINSARIDSQHAQDSFEQNYLQNYSIWMDMDIILKSLVSGTAVFGDARHPKN